MRGEPGCRRRQKPGQRAEQRAEQRAAPHGGRRAPGERASEEPVLPKPLAGPGAGCSAAQAMPGKPCRRVLATHWRKADQILMQPPGVSTEGHGAEVGGAEDRGTGGCCFACRLLSPFPSPFLISENSPAYPARISTISSPLTSKKKKKEKKCVGDIKKKYPLVLKNQPDQPLRGNSVSFK